MPRGRTPRSHDFFFSPRDYLNDPAVLAMSLLARGAYSTLLFALWDLPEPGVAPGTDLALATLARATPEEWNQVREMVACAFDLTSRPGWWVQKRMVLEHIRQQRFYALKSRLGKSGRAKQLTGRARANPGQTPGASQASQAKDQTKTVLGVGTDSENGPPPDPAPVGLPFASRNSGGVDPIAVHRLVQAGVDSSLADELVEKQEAARRRLGIAP